MQRILKFRIPALFCAFTLLVCELISKPFAAAGICDDGPYILMAQHLATTGHIAYNGSATAMLGAQLYLGAAFIKLFCFSFTTVRSSTLFLSLLTAVLLQPYVIPTPLLPKHLPVRLAITQLGAFVLDIPFLILPLIALFLFVLRTSSRRTILSITVLLAGFFLLCTYPSHLRGAFTSLLEPTTGDWITPTGALNSIASDSGTPPLFLTRGVRALLTFICFGGLIGLVYSLVRSTRPPSRNAGNITWSQLGVLFVPFTLAYILLLLSAVATTNYIYDRYALGLLIIAIICLLRFYQQRIHPQIPLAASFFILAMAIYGIAVTHNTFSLYRARVALANELAAAGVPPTSLDNGWDGNFVVELQHANHINEPRLTKPADAYTPVPLPQPDTCPMFWYDRTPHIHPLYGVAFDPNACYGPAPFAPIHYSRWLTSQPGTLYVVRYVAPTNP